jgi:regulator of sigma E protease
MIQLLVDFRDYVVVFLAVITAIVFVHEMGHFLVARACGVRVETFSIGFGPELFGRTSRSGTRWRVSLLPLGGYVRMFGDLGDFEGPGDSANKLAAMTPEERAVAYRTKRVYQRAAIAAAGPAANFIFGIVLLAIMFGVYGQPQTPPVFGEVQAGSAAEAAGLKAGDKVLTANGEEVATFQDLQRIVRLTVGEPVDLQIERGGQTLAVSVRPRMNEITDAFGNKQKVPLLGVAQPPDATKIVHHTPWSALVAATRDTGQMVSATLKGVGQMLSGQRNSDQLSGPVGIAKQVGQAAHLGLAGVLIFAVYISINLGLVNLFPIPLLDGGHLLFYGVEAILGRPLGQRVQEYGFRVGLILVLALMVLATGNDLGIWKLIRGVIS